MIDVKIKLLDGGIMPTKAHNDDAAWDCYARECVEVGKEPVLIGLGFAIEPPKGYYVEIAPRSSIGFKTPAERHRDYRQWVQRRSQSYVRSQKTSNEI